jgi:uncharacterized protein (DUF1697 family)
MLRAVNVGGHIVKMDRLRSLFGALSFTDVSTFIASGNVLFDAAPRASRALEQRIEQHLREALGFEVATFLRSPAELRAIIEHDAFPSSVVRSAHALWIGFLKEPPTAAARDRVLALAGATDDFHVQGREIYWLRRVTSSKALVSGSAVERALGGPMTARNVSTVRKLAALCR